MRYSANDPTLEVLSAKVPYGVVATKLLRFAEQQSGVPIDIPSCLGNDLWHNGRSLKQSRLGLCYFFYKKNCIATVTEYFYIKYGEERNINLSYFEIAKRLKSCAVEFDFAP